MHKYIIIDINSDLTPVTYPIDTDEEIAVAEIALHNAGLAYEDVWVGNGPDAVKTGQKLFATRKTNETPEIIYYEIHVTLDPVFDERLEALAKVAEPRHFRVADLLMQKRSDDTPERSKYDSFLTARADSYDEARRMLNMMELALVMNGFTRRRSKIEAVVFDERTIADPKFGK